MTYSIDSNEIIHAKIMGMRVVKFTKNVDLKAFYNDLYLTLAFNKKKPFYDMIGDKSKYKFGDFFGYQVKEGEQVDNGGDPPNRQGPIYERKFTWSKMQDAVEFEMLWEARCATEYSPYGWITLKIDLVNRLMKDVELLQGNDKVILQSGTWEFRNEIVYHNAVVYKFLNNVPIVKNNKILKQLYVDHIYDKILMNDINIFGEEKIKPLVLDVINKHFS